MASDPSPRPRSWLPKWWSELPTRARVGAAIVAVLSSGMTLVLNAALPVVFERYVFPDAAVEQDDACADLGRHTADPGIALQMGVRAGDAEDDDCFAPALADASVGDEFEVIVHFVNRSARQADDVTLRAWLEPGLELVPGTTRWYNARNLPGGVAAEGSGVVTEGINLGSYSPDANVWTTFTVRLVSVPEQARPCAPPTSLIWANVRTSMGSSPWSTSTLLAPVDCDFSTTPTPAP